MELVQGWASDGADTGVGMRWSWYRVMHQMELVQECASNGVGTGWASDEAV